MELRDVLLQMMQENQQAGQPTDLRVGTVTRTDPLEITINTAMAPLRRGVLYLTEAVVEKKIPVLAHSHTTSGLAHAHSVSGLGHTHPTGGSDTGEGLSGSYTTGGALSQDRFESSVALDDVTCIEDGRPLPVEDGYIILNRALAYGDKVLLLRVQNGQRFIVLSRVF